MEDAHEFSCDYISDSAFRHNNQPIKLNGTYGLVKINSHFSDCVFRDCVVNKTVSINSTNREPHTITKQFKGKKKIDFDSGEFKEVVRISDLINCTITLLGGTFKNGLVIKDIRNPNLERSFDIDVSKVKGTIHVLDCSFHTVSIRGVENSDVKVIFNNVDIQQLLINDYHAKNGLQLNNIYTTNTNDSKISFFFSDLGNSTLDKFHFYEYSEISIISTNFSKALLRSCLNLDVFAANINVNNSSVEENLRMTLHNFEESVKYLKDTGDTAIIEYEEHRLKTFEEKLKIYLEHNNPKYELKEVFKEFRLAFKNSGDGENERIAYKYEMLWYKAYLNHERKSILLPPNDLAQKYRTLTLKKINIWFNEAILCVSYHYGHFGNNLGKAITTGVIVNSILFIILLFLQWYNPSPCNIDTNSAIEMVNTFLKKLLNPLEKMDVDNPYMIFDLLFKFNSGLFFYNIIRASRKFYH